MKAKKGCPFRVDDAIGSTEHPCSAVRDRRKTYCPRHEFLIAEMGERRARKHESVERRIRDKEERERAR